MPNDLINAADIFTYDPLTGVVRWLKTGNIAGFVNRRGYRLINYKGKRYRSHRLVWVIHNGCIADGEMDHINGVKDDNRIINLRVVTTQENQKNTKMHKHNTSGCMGVHFHTRDKKWTVRIKINRKYIHLGSYKTKEEAIKVRKDAEIKYGFHSNHGRLSLKDMMR